LGRAFTKTTLSFDSASDFGFFNPAVASFEESGFVFLRTTVRQTTIAKETAPHEGSKKGAAKKAGENKNELLSNTMA
jgi:hypothetical protein